MTRPWRAKLWRMSFMVVALLSLDDQGFSRCLHSAPPTSPAPSGAARESPPVARLAGLRGRQGDRHALGWRLLHVRIGVGYECAMRYSDHRQRHPGSRRGRRHRPRPDDLRPDRRNGDGTFTDATNVRASPTCRATASASRSTTSMATAGRTSWWRMMRVPSNCFGTIKTVPSPRSDVRRARL